MEEKHDTAVGKKASSPRGRKPVADMKAPPLIVEDPSAVPLTKQYYSISEVAEMFQTSTSQIRFWEKEFDILQPKKNRKGDRLFRPEDIEHLRLIYYLIRERKYTVEGAKQKLKEEMKTTRSRFELIQTLQRIKQFLIQLKEQI
ncbi:MerR family transcriptional regulator [Thermoflavifilum thermophilum]|uniref:DNA-binding transcriptional regulator, MerR family n=1 Tax=Thermoflavifilum thermophilum TaxID=1393122 RepID=A0A1I7N8I9_9BACT|nr:MerR family transcriptional regulator [Thermoflavifilum thermophilum]SFV31002.1 DNA-binding transcriptional regulator, MerR family [Thermoflavifilum thermophilum]